MSGFTPVYVEEGNSKTVELLYGTDDIRITVEKDGQIVACYKTYKQINFVKDGTHVRTEEPDIAYFVTSPEEVSKAITYKSPIDGTEKTIMIAEIAAAINQDFINRKKAQVGM